MQGELSEDADCFNTTVIWYEYVMNDWQRWLKKMNTCQLDGEKKLNLKSSDNWKTKGKEQENIKKHNHLSTAEIYGHLYYIHI